MARDVMANVWMHNGFLQVEGQKMSKSDGNFVTIHELLETEKFGGRKWPGEVLRLAMLMTHYREPIDFSVRRLEEANAISTGFLNLIRRYGPNDGHVMPEVVEALSDDLNTRLAVMAIQNGAADLADIAASIYFLGLEDKRTAEIGAKIRTGQTAGVRAAVEDAFDRVALEQAGTSKDELQKTLENRLALIREKNFAEADKIREDLAKQGVQLMDYKDPETGERKTKWEVRR